MADAKFTKGPWKVGGDGQLWVEPPDPKENVICDIFERTLASVSEEDEANAHLIAAAPEMYEALKEVRTALVTALKSAVDPNLYSSATEWHTAIRNHVTVKRIDAAIAKAEGR